MQLRKKHERPNVECTPTPLVAGSATDKLFSSLYLGTFSFGKSANGTHLADVASYLRRATAEFVRSTTVIDEYRYDEPREPQLVVEVDSVSYAEPLNEPFTFEVVPVSPGKGGRPTPPPPRDTASDHTPSASLRSDTYARLYEVPKDLFSGKTPSVAGSSSLLAPQGREIAVRRQQQRKYALSTRGTAVAFSSVDVRHEVAAGTKGISMSRGLQRGIVRDEVRRQMEASLVHVRHRPACVSKAAYSGRICFCSACHRCLPIDALQGPSESVGAPRDPLKCPYCSETLQSDPDTPSWDGTAGSAQVAECEVDSREGEAFRQAVEEWRAVDSTTVTSEPRKGISIERCYQMLYFTHLSDQLKDQLRSL